MSLSSVAMKALAAAGATLEMVIAAVEAEEAVAAEHLRIKRAKDAERKRLSRLSQNVRNVTRTTRTPRDITDAGDKKEIPPTPPKEKTTFSELPRGSSSKDASASPDAYLDFKHELWGEGPPILVALGVPSKQARSLIGRWMRDIRDDARGLLEILRRAFNERPQDPIPWITRAIPARAQGPPTGRGGGFVALMLEQHEEQQRERTSNPQLRSAS